MRLRRTTITAGDADEGILDELDDIVALKSFQVEETDETPSSATASLPTPQGNHHPLGVLDNILGYSHYESSTRSTTWPVTPTPGAPKLKDYDSFTEGTAQGSFDWLSTASADDLCDPLLRFNEAPAVLEVLSGSSGSECINTSVSIETWRAGVLPSTSNGLVSPLPEGNASDDQHTPRSAKRPRSLTPSEGTRRARPRAVFVGSGHGSTSSEPVSSFERPPKICRASSAPPSM